MHARDHGRRSTQGTYLICNGVTVAGATDRAKDGKALEIAADRHNG